MLGRRGQITTEVIIIAVMLLGLLLATAVIMVQQNIRTTEFFEIQIDMLACEDISSMITNFNTNEGFGEARIASLQKNAWIRKNDVSIGTSNCKFAGKAWKEVGEDDYVEDITGFYLDKGKVHKVEKTGIGVVFCEDTQAWC